MRRFTVSEYHRLGEFGVLTESDRVELLEGWIAKKMIHNPRHDATVARSNRTIGSAVPDGWHVRVQSSVTTDDSEPEPDLAVVRGSEEAYADRHPGGGDVALIVEVADSSLKSDREIKGPIYARAGIGCYWIVNVSAREVEVFSEPFVSEGRYGERRRFGAGDRLPLIIDGIEVSRILVDDLLVR